MYQGEQCNQEKVSPDSGRIMHSVVNLTFPTSPNQLSYPNLSFFTRTLATYGVNLNPWLEGPAHSFPSSFSFLSKSFLISTFLSYPSLSYPFQTFSPTILLYSSIPSKPYCVSSISQYFIVLPNTPVPTCEMDCHGHFAERRYETRLTLLRCTSPPPATAGRRTCPPPATAGNRTCSPPASAGRRMCPPPANAEQKDVSTTG